MGMRMGQTSDQHKNYNCNITHDPPVYYLYPLASNVVCRLKVTWDRSSEELSDSRRPYGPHSHVRQQWHLLYTHAGLLYTKRTIYSKIDSFA